MRTSPRSSRSWSSRLPAARAQQEFAPIIRESPAGLVIDWPRVAIVAFVIASAVLANVSANFAAPEFAAGFPVIGAAVALSLPISIAWRKPDWGVLPGAATGSAFLLCLVALASLMPVQSLPQPSWQSTFVLGFVSAFFDNIPLTALALKQGGYDWGVLAFSVGFGGSIIWFGSSAGVAICNMFPEARSTGDGSRRLARGPGYVAGFAVLLTLGWNPEP